LEIYLNFFPSFPPGQDTTPKSIARPPPPAPSRLETPSKLRRYLLLGFDLPPPLLVNIHGVSLSKCVLLLILAARVSTIQSMSFPLKETSSPFRFQAVHFWYEVLASSPGVLVSETVSSLACYASIVIHPHGIRLVPIGPVSYKLPTSMRKFYSVPFNMMDVVGTARAYLNPPPPWMHGGKDNSSPAEPCLCPPLGTSAFSPAPFAPNPLPFMIHRISRLVRKAFFYVRCPTSSRSFFLPGPLSVKLKFLKEITFWLGLRMLPPFRSFLAPCMRAEYSPSK